MSTPRSEQFDHVSRWRASGLSMAAYCRKESLVYHRFTYWVQQDQLRLVGASNVATVSPEVITDHFTCVDVSPSVDCPTPTLALALPSGARLECGRSCTSKELVALVQAVLT